MKISIEKIEVAGYKKIQIEINGVPFQDAIFTGKIKGYEVLGIIEMAKHELMLFLKGA